MSNDEPKPGGISEINIPDDYQILVFLTYT